LTGLKKLGMPSGIMKTSYLAIAAVGLAAAVLCNVRYGKQETQMMPFYPAPSESSRTDSVDLPPLPIIPKAPFPEINPPSDSALVIPEPSTMILLPPLPRTDESQAEQAIQIPTIPLPLPRGVPTEAVSATPGILPIEQIQSSPVVPSIPIPTVPQPPTAQTIAPTTTIPQIPVSPVSPAAPNSLVAPSPPVPVGPPKPPTSVETAGSSLGFTAHGKFVVLRGKEIGAASEKKTPIGEIMASKLIAIEGIGAVDKKDIVVQQGAIVRNIPRVEVLFVGETHNDVYRFMRDRAPADDEVARLAVARWCMFNGMREQALAEATAILQFKPGSKYAADLARSLEESLKQFPPGGTTAAAKQQDVKTVSSAEGEIDVTPEAATSFATRIQPILANLCVDCHARQDHAGAFKLTRITGFEAGPQSSLANLRTTVGQLLKTDPLNSPLLSKAITAHGGLKQPPFPTRQAPGFRTLENWVAVAVGTTVAPTGGNQTASPNAQQTQPAVVSTPFGSPASTQPTVPSIPSGLPPVETAPALPATNPVTAPGISVPAVPSAPVAPPVVIVPPVLPTPPMMKPTVPTQPPIVPAAETAPPVLPQPMVPSPPAISIPKIPPAQSGAQPVNGPSGGSQFGSEAPAKAVQPGSPSARDEFDPSIFNQGVPKK
jgi:hypothetical protein